MSTRSVIARPTPTGFEGVYHHWDGYPEGLGRTLFYLYRGTFVRSSEAMLAVLIDQHPGGWSTINGKDLTLPAGQLPGIGAQDASPCVARIEGKRCGQGYDVHLCQNTHPFEKPCVEGNYALHLGHKFTPSPLITAALERVPECFCHDETGSRTADPSGLVTEASASGSGCEWAYVIRDDRMVVLSSMNEDGSKMIGFFGMGNAVAGWSTAGVVDLNGREPDWKRLTQLGYGEAA